MEHGKHDAPMKQYMGKGGKKMMKQMEHSMKQKMHGEFKRKSRQKDRGGPG